LRPARRSSPDEGAVAQVLRFPVASFVAHVIGQYDRPYADPRLAAQSYEAADALVPPQGTLLAKKL